MRSRAKIGLVIGVLLIAGGLAVVMWKFTHPLCDLLGHCFGAIPECLPTSSSCHILLLPTPSPFGEPIAITLFIVGGLVIVDSLLVGRQD